MLRMVLDRYRSVSTITGVWYFSAMLKAL